MKIVKQSWEWMQKPILPLETIELAGRTCYKSEDKITDGSAKKFVESLLKRGHLSVIEHVSASVRFITNRSISHELVRHRLASFSQSSTRYCNYSGEMEFILPVWMSDVYLLDQPKLLDILKTKNKAARIFILHCLSSSKGYNDLLQLGWRPEQAREILPNALKTEIVMTTNLREWIHVFKLRTAKAAHPQMRALMQDCLKGFQKEIPVLFDDIGEHDD